MVDDFMVCVDRLIATACFESTNSGNGVGSRDHTARLVGTEATKSECDGGCVKSNGGGGEGCSSKKKMVTDMVECRICQEEDDAHAMEAPCACNGTLKFAHRKCIQKWCNKKGNITCEICNQVFSPNYSLPMARSNTDVIAIDIRQAWAQRMDLHDSHLLALAAAERHLLQSEYDDFSLANTTSIACIRSVALILLIIVLLRQVLMIIRDTGMVQESSTFFNFQVSLLQFAGFLLPCYVMARSCYTMQIRRRRQG